MRTSIRLALALSTLAPLGAAQTLVYSLPGPVTGDHFGYRVEVVGDINGDGGDDFLLAVPGADGHSGRVELRSGMTGGLISSLPGGAADLLGASIAVLGDIDNDQVPDWIVGAPQVGVRGSGFLDVASGPGFVTLVSGATQGVIRTHSGVSLGDAFGHAVGGGEDVDGDGVPDYVVGAPVAETVTVYSGAGGGLIDTYASFGPETGYSVALIPDVDADTFADVAIGMTQGFTGFSSEVRAYSGDTQALVWSRGGGIGSELGWSIWSTDDLNGDDVQDLIVFDRIWGNSLGALGEGRLSWLDGATGADLHTLSGSEPGLGEALGHGLAHLRDLDGDGHRDVAIGVPGLYESNGSSYPGHPLQIRTGWPPAEVGSIAPVDENTTFGQALASGDLDGDGITDLVLGSPRDNGIQAVAGQVRIYSLLSDPQVYCTSQANSQGCVPRAWWTGTPSAAASTLRVRAADVLNNKFGVLFWGPGPEQLPFGGGTLCVGSPVKRTDAQFSGGNVPPEDCSGTFTYQFTSAYLTAEGLTPGTSVYCQYWSRDPADASNFNVSDALLFTVLP